MYIHPFRKTVSSTSTVSVIRLLNADRSGKLSTPPDYVALVKLLPALRNLVDACGEVTLTAEEAERILSLGFEAQSGRWKCPPLPPELTRDNSLLEPLSAKWGERTPLQAIPKNEGFRETRTANQQGGETRVSRRHLVEAVPDYYKTGRPTPQPRTAPDSALIEEAASKIVESLQRRRANRSPRGGFNNCSGGILHRYSMRPSGWLRDDSISS